MSGYLLAMELGFIVLIKAWQECYIPKPILLQFHLHIITAYFCFSVLNDRHTIVMKLESNTIHMYEMSGIDVLQNTSTKSNIFDRLYIQKGNTQHKKLIVNEFCH